MWQIWKARNSTSLNGEVVNPKDIVNKALFDFLEYESNLIPPSPPIVIHSCNDGRNLTVAQDGIVAFADASVHKKKKNASIGVAAMDSYGNLLHAFGTPIQYVRKSITVEAIAIRMAMENASANLIKRKKCGGYGTTKNNSLMGERDYL
ncbi:hypothetical protein EJD97_017627 [Solanum chilense]|uniref:RNase H type-1 domain-containing protein n=1 Tax=Solanum chilense TaxID=4083 RepID=A0A6N2CCT5_SOLCI|nr:hypothetical protein EJD97_017627 [Solanum chilense]